MPPAIQDTKRRHTASLMSLPGVLAVGIGKAPDGRHAVIVSVARGGDQTAPRLPAELEGHPVIVQITGEVRALSPGRLR